MSKEPNGREPDFSEEDIQREQLGPRRVPGKESPAKMTAQQQKKTPEDVDSATRPRRSRLINGDSALSWVDPIRRLKTEWNRMRTSDDCRSQLKLSDLLVPLVGNRDEVASTHHFWFFRPNPVCDESAVLLGFCVVDALVPHHVMSGDIAS